MRDLDTCEKVLEAALAAVAAEEELAGRIPAGVKLAAQMDPTRSLRAAVVATKRGIDARIRALAARIPPTQPPDPQPEELRERIEKALLRFNTDDRSRAFKRIPAHPTDVDVVLRDCFHALSAPTPQPRRLLLPFYPEDLSDEERKDGGTREPAHLPFIIRRATTGWVLCRMNGPYIMEQVDCRTAFGTQPSDEVREALRALLTALSDEESNRDGEYLLPPDPGCIRCTRGVADSGKLCARHAAESALAKEPGRG